MISTKNVFIIHNNLDHQIIILCDTEDWINDCLKISFAITGNLNYIWKI